MKRTYITPACCIRDAETDFVMLSASNISVIDTGGDFDVKGKNPGDDTQSWGDIWNEE